MTTATDPFNTGADTHYASTDGDWREELDDDDPDDELIDTPSDVIAILGFDPAEDEESPDEAPVQFAVDSTDPDLDDMIALGTSESVKRIRAAKKSIAGIVKKKA